MRGRFGELYAILRESAGEWSRDGAPQLSAAIAYYAIFSLAPLLVIATWVAGIVFGEKAARGEIVGMIDQLTGRVAAEQIETMIQNAGNAQGGVLATLLGIAALLFGATGVFYQLSSAVNRVWGIEDTTSGRLEFLRDRALSFALVVAVGFLLIVSLLVSAVLSGFVKAFEHSIGSTGALLRVAELGLSLAVLTLLFALLYRYLPDRRVAWRYLWIGAGTTSLLFVIGKFAIGLYLGRSAVATTFGAAGSLAVVLVWIYYSSLIFLFGAEVTEVVERRRKHEAQGRAAPPRGCAAGPTSELPHPYPELGWDSRRSGSGVGIAAGAAGGLTLGCVGGVVTTFVLLVRSLRLLLRR